MRSSGIIPVLATSRSLPLVPDPPEVSVIILHRNSYPMLSTCISSLISCTVDVGYEIVVVDNGSTDDSVELTRKDYPTVKLVAAGINLGYGRGNNLGSRTATGKYLLFLNDDTLVQNNILKRMLDFMKEHPELRIGAIGPTILTDRGEASHSFGRFPNLFSQLRIVATRLGWLKKRPVRLGKMDRPVQGWFPVDYVVGAAMFVPGEVFKKFGGFDEEFYLYFEETELQYRMSRSGYGRYIVEGPLLIHYGGGARRRSNWRRIETYRSMFLYFWKTHTPVGFVLFSVSIWVFVLAHLFHPAFTLKENVHFICRCWSAMLAPRRRRLSYDT